MKKDNHKMKNDNFFEAWGNATNGIIYSATTQRNIRIQLVLASISNIFLLSSKNSKIPFEPPTTLTFINCMFYLLFIAF